MYRNIFKTLENRFKEYESLEKYLDEHIDELQTENDSFSFQSHSAGYNLSAASSSVSFISILH